MCLVIELAGSSSIKYWLPQFSRMKCDPLRMLTHCAAGSKATLLPQGVLSASGSEMSECHPGGKLGMEKQGLSF